MWSVWSRFRLPSQCLRILYAERLRTSVFGLRQVGLAFDGIEDFSSQDHSVPAAAPLGKPASQDLLGVALFATPAVDVGGVEEIDAELQGPVHDLETLFLGGVPAKVHGAQTDVAYQDPVFSQTFVFDCHVRVPLLFKFKTSGEL